MWNRRKLAIAAVCAMFLAVLPWFSAKDASEMYSVRSRKQVHDLQLPNLLHSIQDPAEESFDEPVENPIKPMYQVETPPTAVLNKDDFIFLHPGRAGGTAVKERLENVWRLKFKSQHPYPYHPEENADGHPYMIFAIRDPVDRFVSAFQWSVEQVRNNQHRLLIPPNETNSTVDYDENDELRHILLDQYDQNVSMLAVDLCSTDNTTADMARYAVETIPHLKHSITDWVAFPWSGDHIFPVVIDAMVSGSGTPLEDQVDQAVEWLFTKLQFESEEAFARRRRYAQQHNSRTTHPEKELTANQAGEMCLEQVFREDYDMLIVLQAAACKTEACEDNILSILVLRAHLFAGEQNPISEHRMRPQSPTATPTILTWSNFSFPLNEEYAKYNHTSSYTLDDLRNISDTQTKVPPPPSLEAILKKSAPSSPYTLDELANSNGTHATPTALQEALRQKASPRSSPSEPLSNVSREEIQTNVASPVEEALQEKAVPNSSAEKQENTITTEEAAPTNTSSPFE